MTPPANEEPITEEPWVEPPTSEPVTAEPPTSEPPTAEPPTAVPSTPTRESSGSVGGPPTATFPPPTRESSGSDGTPPTATLAAPIGATAVPAISEQRRLTLDFPPKIRAGDSDIVRLTLEVDDQGNLTPTAQVEGHEVTGEVVQIPNFYDTHTVIVESRLDMAGVQVLPPDRISEPLLPGQKVTFLWSISAEDEGNYKGIVWLYLRFIPKAGGDALTSTISAQTIDVEATKYFGILKASPARQLGAIGSILGAILGFPFVDDILKYLWKEVRGKDEKEKKSA